MSSCTAEMKKELQKDTVSDRFDGGFDKRDVESETLKTAYFACTRFGHVIRTMCRWMKGSSFLCQVLLSNSNLCISLNNVQLTPCLQCPCRIAYPNGAPGRPRCCIIADSGRVTLQPYWQHFSGDDSGLADCSCLVFGAISTGYVMHRTRFGQFFLLFRSAMPRPTRL